MISNSVTHLRSYINSAIADIARNSVRAPLSPRAAPSTMSPRRAPISLHRMESVRVLRRVSDPMLSHVPKSGHFLDYLNFGALFDFFLWSIYWNLCNLALVKCLLKLSPPNLYKLNIFKWSNYGTKGVDHWVTYPNVSQCFKSGSRCFTTFHDVSQYFTSVSWCFTMFNNVLWCLVSRATIGIAASATAGNRDRR